MLEGMRRRGRITQRLELRDRTYIFRDRAHAGQVLAGMLDKQRGSGALVLAIPAGGVPVALEIADELELELDLAVVSKITLPWNTEAGYGAVAFDGSVQINYELVKSLGLNRREVEAGIQRTRAKVKQRMERLRGDRPLPSLAGRTTILVDDGLASGYTLLAAARAVREAGSEKLLVAVPTAHSNSVPVVAAEADAVHCANLRGGVRFAVAEAYENWHDVSEEELEQLLSRRAGS
jgi:predicted phosphoribosyltransferase